VATPMTHEGWVTYYAKRWCRHGRSSLLQLALYYEFLRLMEMEP
jgi:hypothetical protein